MAELRDLNDEERLALVALIEWVAKANARVSEEESEQIAAIADAFGEDAYRRAAEEVHRRFDNEEDLRAFLPSIGRREVRDLIYTEVLEAAMADAIDRREGEFLEWLADVWEVTTRIEEPDSEDTE